MALYTVFAPRVADGAPDPMATAFVKEGFSWPAFFFAEIWMIVCRMWLVLVLYIAAVVLVSLAGRLVGDNLAGAVIFLGHLLFALEGNELKRWTLARRGFVMVDVVEARNEAEAEIRFFAREILPVGDDATPPSPPPPMPPRAPASRPGEDVVGLFPAPAESLGS